MIRKINGAHCKHNSSQCSQATQLHSDILAETANVINRNIQVPKYDRSESRA